MGELHLYDDDTDWVVARDPDDALSLWCEQAGEDVDDYRNENHFGRVPDDAEVSVWVDAAGDIAEADDDGATIARLTAAEVVRRYGRGWLASRES